MTTLQWPVLLPPLVAIILAIATRKILISLMAGIWMGWTLIHHLNPLLGLIAAVEACLATIQDMGNLMVVVFVVLVGALIRLMQASGGVDAFVNWATNLGVANTKPKAGILAMFIGFTVFVETNISCLTMGAVCRPLFDRLKISRAKLAYICDSTSAPVCGLIPFNAWGAFLVGLLAQESISSPFSVMISALPFHFYTFIALLGVFLSVAFGLDFGPMTRAEPGVEILEAKQTKTTSLWNMFFPLGILVGGTLFGLWLTGNGDLMKGSGSRSVFWAVTAAVALSSLSMILRKSLTKEEVAAEIKKGMLEMVPMGLLMIAAFGIGSTCRELGTGIYVANLAQAWLNPGLLPLAMFLIAGFISFSTGTSWGTFATMIPIGIPAAVAMEVHLPLVFGAIVGGGIFGDHCSPISDTTVISSLASGCEPIEHVRTQLPYALLAGFIASLGYLACGLWA